MEKDEYWFWLGNIPGVGSRTALRLVNAFGGNICALFEAEEKRVDACHIVNKAQLQSIIYSRNRDRIQHDYEQIKSKGIQCISIENSFYPDTLKYLYDPPVILYILGSLPKADEWMIALIGARQSSS